MLESNSIDMCVLHGFIFKKILPHPGHRVKYSTPESRMQAEGLLHLHHG